MWEKSEYVFCGYSSTQKVGSAMAEIRCVQYGHYYLTREARSYFENNGEVDQDDKAWISKFLASNTDEFCISLGEVQSVDTLDKNVDVISDQRLLEVIRSSQISDDVDVSSTE